MPAWPVTCADCGTPLDNEDSTTPEDQRIPCPTCGSLARTAQVTVTDSGIGTDSVSVVRQIVETIISIPATPEDYRELSEFIRSARSSGLLPGHFKNYLRHSTPFGALADLLPDNKEQAYAFLGMLITAITLIVQVAQGPRDQPQTPTITPDQVEQIIERVTEHSAEDQAAPAAEQPAAPRPGAADLPWNRGSQ